MIVPLGGLTAEGSSPCPAALRREQRVPLVIAQHGIGSFPGAELRPAGRQRRLSQLRPGAGQGRLRRDRADEPALRRAAQPHRAALPAGRHEPAGHRAGPHAAPVGRSARPIRGIDPQRVGMWGLSLGGLATMFWTPLEPRIKVAVVAGWFNHRRNKMVIPDKRYSCFLDTKEEHAFFHGWLTGLHRLRRGRADLPAAADDPDRQEGRHRLVADGRRGVRGGQGSTT